MRPSLCTGPRAHMSMNFVPILPVELQCLEESSMFLVGPSPRIPIVFMLLLQMKRIEALERMIHSITIQVVIFNSILVMKNSHI